MLFVYSAIFHQEEDSYWVEFPDLPGCQTYGSTITDALKSAQEALSGYLLTILEQNEKLTTAFDSSLYHLEDGFTSLVSCDINRSKDIKNSEKLDAC